MLYREIMAVCSEIHTKHINTVCGQNVEFRNVKPRCSQTKLACVIAFSIQMHNFFYLPIQTEAKVHFLSLSVPTIKNSALFMWIRNLFALTEGRTLAEGV